MEITLDFLNDCKLLRKSVLASQPQSFRCLEWQNTCFAFSQQREPHRIQNSCFLPNHSSEQLTLLWYGTEKSCLTIQTLDMYEGIQMHSSECQTHFLISSKWISGNMAHTQVLKWQKIGTIRSNWECFPGRTLLGQSQNFPFLEQPQSRDDADQTS